MLVGEIGDLLLRWRLSVCSSDKDWLDNVEISEEDVIV